jgi:branched-chain amino acid transport system permease protein
MGFWPVLLLSVVFAAMAGILLGIPVLRMRGDYLAIVTLGFGEIIRVLIRSDMMAPYLGGPQGIRDIAGPSIFGISLTSEKSYLYLIILGIMLTILITNYLQNSRVGRAWMAMREDETVAQAMGINTLYYKLLAFSTGAAFAGLGGALFAARNQYTGPADHTLMVSINVLCLLIVGGMGSIPGVIVGAFVLKGLPEILRELEIYRLLVFGGLLVAMMIVRPEGLWPAPRRKLELHEDEPGGLPPEGNLTASREGG